MPIKKPFSISFQVKLTSIFLVIILTLTSGLIIQGYRSSSIMVMESARNLLLSTNEIILERFGRIFDPVFSIVAISASTHEISRSAALQAAHPAIPFMLKALELNPQLYAVNMGYENGDFYEIARINNQDELKARIGAPPEAYYGLLTIIGREGDETKEKVWIYLNRSGTEISRGKIVESTYDPRKRPWYQIAEEKSGVAMTDMYFYSDLKKPGVSFSHLFNASSKGVFTANLTLTELSNFLSSQLVSKSSRIFLFDEYGKLFAHPDEMRTMKPVVDGKTGITRLEVAKVSDLQDPVVTEVIDRYQNGSWDDLSTIDVAGETYIAKVTPIPERYGDNLAIVLIVPVSEFLGPIAEMGIESAIISILFILFFLPLVILISKWFSTSLQALADEAEQIRLFNLDGTATISSRISEIQQLAGSIATMKITLRSFSSYMPKALVRNIVESGLVPKPGGERREVTILFSDIQGFTSLSEKLEPEEILIQTSRYFEMLTLAISKHNGVIDKFIGDAVMAVWNGLIPNPNHAADACMAMLACREESHALNRRFAAGGKPIFYSRFGLHGGDTVVGNVGSSERIDFTAIGSTVNMAARTEGLNKFYGTQLLVTKNVRDGAGPRFVFRSMDKVVAKGTTQPMEVYELLGEDDPQSPYAIDPDRKKWIALWEEAYALYLNRQWREAMTLFDELQITVPDDQPSVLYRQRCEKHLIHPPGSSWEGVEQYDEK
ncbi:MAG: hypothetical protein HQL52_07960 [Magnetococcales bacterium]|nr:hypothetical protein [Magnetococcales bacterium]